MKILIDSIFSFSYRRDDTFEDINYNGYELLYFMNGKGCITTPRTTTNYHANDIYFSTPNFFRTLTCTEETPYLCIRFHVVGTITDLESGLYTYPDDTIYQLFKNVFTQFNKKDYKYFDYSNLIVQEILIELARLLSTNTSSNQNITTLIKEIDRTLHFDKTVQEMADSLNYSYDYFRHKFKNITGQSVSTYIANKRIENACNLLKEQKYSCTEIANLCGFSSSSQFSKLFKRTIGISPLAYQKYSKTT